MLKLSPETTGIKCCSECGCNFGAMLDPKEEAMRRITLIVRSILLFGVLGTALLAGASSLSSESLAAGGNRCTDRCADRYKIRKDACRLIPLRTERKICERRAKEAKEDCKHRCGH